MRCMIVPIQEVCGYFRLGACRWIVHCAFGRFNGSVHEDSSDIQYLLTVVGAFSPRLRLHAGHGLLRNVHDELVYIALKKNENSI